MLGSALTHIIRMQCMRACFVQYSTYGTHINAYKKMEALQEASASAIDAVATLCHDIGQEIWRNPELGLQEFHAHKLLCGFFREKGFAVDDQLLGPTGFSATYSNGIGDGTDGAGSAKGVHVCLLAEYDALPELGHASAHNLVTEACVATAMGLKAVIDLQKSIGKVTVLGTPDTENNGKKIEAIDSKFFEDVDLAVTFIPFTVNITRPLMLTIMRQTVTFKGKAAHASTCPWDGKNALDAAVLCYNNIAVLRQQLKAFMQIHCVISNGGLRPNIIPQETEMKFYLRARDHIDMAQLQQRADAAFKAAAKATGCELEIAFTPTPYSNLCSNSKLSDLYRQQAEQLGVQFEAVTDRAMHLVGSSDAGNVSHVIPTIAPAFDIGDEAISTNSQSFTDVAGTEDAHQRTMIAAKAMSKALIHAMCDPETMASIKSEFDADICKASMTPWH